MKNKLKFLTVFALLSIGAINAQTGIGTTTPDASAVLDVSSTNKGLLLPRMTTTQRNAIVNPAAGLQVYDTNTNSNWFFNNTAWVSTTSASITGTAPIDVTAGVVSLNDAGVTTIKLADDAITSAKILDGTVATADLVNNAVTIAKLPTGATASTFLKGDGTWASPAIKGLVNCDGTITQTITNANVTATSSIYVSYEDISGDIIYTTIKERTVGTGFTVQFGAIPSTSAKINYIIVQ